MGNGILTAADHRTVARLLRKIATEHVDREARQQLMLRAIEHEADAENLDQRVQLPSPKSTAKGQVSN